MPQIWPIGGGKGGTGKTFVTGSLGILLAGEGYQTLLIDLDPGAANLHTAIGAPDPENPFIQDILQKDRLTGEDLKRIRTTLGLTLAQIFLQTRIAISILEAIEDDRFDRLPPAVYLKGFLKLYAQCLQIDANTVVQAYMKHMKGDN
jgi:cellulose biosynthesis protein BcsQ